MDRLGKEGSASGPADVARADVKRTALKYIEMAAPLLALTDHAMTKDDFARLASRIFYLVVEAPMAKIHEETRRAGPQAALAMAKELAKSTAKEMAQMLGEAAEAGGGDLA